MPEAIPEDLEHPVDNAPVRSLAHKGMTVEGYSRAAVQTYWRVPEMKVGFDLGAQPWDFMGTPTWFLSHTHLDHVGETARQNSIDLIINKIQAFNRQALPVIFMGDLNSTPDMPVLSKLKKVMLDTREASAAPPFGPAGTFNGFKFGEPVIKLIDYIFVSDTPLLRVKKYAVLSDNRNLHYPSDHLPVLVELELTK